MTSPEPMAPDWPSLLSTSTTEGCTVRITLMSVCWRSVAAYGRATVATTELRPALTVVPESPDPLLASARAAVDPPPAHRPPPLSPPLSADASAGLPRGCYA